MQVILMERVAKLGQMGDVVTVKQGYARNYLLPLKKAMRATEANIKVFETQKSHMEARNLEAKSEADSVAKKLDGKQFIIIRSASDTGSLTALLLIEMLPRLQSQRDFQLIKNKLSLTSP